MARLRWTRTPASRSLRAAMVWLPNLLYRWRRLMLEGGAVAVSGDDDVTSNRTVLQMEDRIRELERQFERKTLEVEILKGALDKSRSIN